MSIIISLISIYAWIEVCGELTAKPLNVLLEWYEDKPLNDLEDEPRVAAWADELLGVVGPVVAVVLDPRAVRGVGALICDFFGVSVTCLVRLLVTVGADSSDFDVLEGVLVGLGRLPPATKGCRMAACGLIRRSGSQTRHLAMKSTNSSSLHLRTWASVLVPGRRLRPLELTTARGAPLGSALNQIK